MICADTLDLFVVHAWRYHADWRRVAALLDAHAPRGWRNFSLPWYDPALDARTPDGGQKVRWHLESQIIPAHAVLLLAGVWREPGTHKWLSFEIEVARKHGKPVFALPAWGETDVPADVVEQADAVVAWDAGAIFALARTDRREEAPVG
jgi:hypothetical protein